MLSSRAIRGNIRRGAARKNWFHMGCCWRINWLCHCTSAWTFSFTAHLPLFISLMLFQLFTSAHMLMTYKKKWRDFLISEHVFSPEGWNPIEGMGASTPLLPLLLTLYFSPSLSEKCEKESKDMQGSTVSIFFHWCIPVINVIFVCTQNWLQSLLSQSTPGSTRLHLRFNNMRQNMWYLSFFVTYFTEHIFLQFYLFCFQW